MFKLFLLTQETIATKHETKTRSQIFFKKCKRGRCDCCFIANRNNSGFPQQRRIRLPGCETKVRNRKTAESITKRIAGEYLNRVAFPLGGMGAGMFCIEGTGAISHMSIRNKPDIFNTPEAFAAISIKGLKSGAKLLEGPVPDWKKFGQRDRGQWIRRCNHRVAAFSSCYM
jgi:hypothetical protein